MSRVRCSLDAKRFSLTPKIQNWLDLESLTPKIYHNMNSPYVRTCPPHPRARARAPRGHVCPPCAKTAHTILLLIAHRSEMSTARVTLKFGEIPFEAFFAGAANVIFRHASTGVWVKEVREYASTRVREYASTRARKVGGPCLV